MPVKLGKKKYEKFSNASAAIQKKKGISKDRTNAYVASIERKQGIEPRTGKRTKTKTSKRNNNNSTANTKKTRQPQRKKTRTG
jgi:hypothetical protein